MVRDHFWKNCFLPIFDAFLVAKQPIFKAFRDFGRAKTGHHKLKTRQKHLFWHSMWSRIIFKKKSFFCTRWTLWTHFGTQLFGLRLAACRNTSTSNFDHFWATFCPKTAHFQGILGF